MFIFNRKRMEKSSQKVRETNREMRFFMNNKNKKQLKAETMKTNIAATIGAIEPKGVLFDFNSNKSQRESKSFKTMKLQNKKVYFDAWWENASNCA